MYWQVKILLLAALAAPAIADGGLALLEASSRGDAPQVKRLLDAGAPVDARDARQRTPLLLATWGNHPEVARLLIQAGADVNAKDSQQDSPYLLAGARGRDEILGMTLRHGADLASTNRYQGTALIPACERGHAQAARQLIASGVKLDHVNRLGWTCLLEVAILGTDGPQHRDIVRQLIVAKADLNLADRDGVTALQHARRRGLSGVATLLADAGAR